MSTFDGMIYKRSRHHQENNTHWERNWLDVVTRGQRDFLILHVCSNVKWSTTAFCWKTLNCSMAHSGGTELLPAAYWRRIDVWGGCFFPSKLRKDRLGLKSESTQVARWLERTPVRQFTKFLCPLIHIFGANVVHSPCHRPKLKTRMSLYGFLPHTTNDLDIIDEISILTWMRTWNCW